MKPPPPIFVAFMTTALVGGTLAWLAPSEPTKIAGTSWRQELTDRTTALFDSCEKASVAAVCSNHLRLAQATEQEAIVSCAKKFGVSTCEITLSRVSVQPTCRVRPIGTATRYEGGCLTTVSAIANPKRPEVMAQR